MFGKYPVPARFPKIYKGKKEATMTLPDDETLAEEALEEVDGNNLEEGSTSSPAETSPPAVPLESGMETGQGADDEPELAIGDRHIADAEHVSPEEARRLLGGEDG